MHLNFPLADVTIEQTSNKIEVETALYDDGFYRLNQTEFSMDVPGVGWFYAANGNYINAVLDPKATKPAVELYLNGSAYGAILHQRCLLPLHGSSFVYRNKGIMLCGESGAGKSSLTAAFCKDGSAFLTDDVSPLTFNDHIPYILPLSDRIKLWQDSLEQLYYDKKQLTEIWQDYSKYYLPVKPKSVNSHVLDIIFIIEKHKNSEVVMEEVQGMNKFEQLRNEIYRWEYLQGMKGTEADYLHKIIDLNLHVKVIKVRRPEDIKIKEMKNELTAFIDAGAT